MNTQPSNLPPDDPSGRQLRRRITRTSPDFEARFRELKTGLAARGAAKPAAAVLPFPVRLRTLALATGAIAALAAGSAALLHWAWRSGPGKPAPQAAPVFAAEDPFLLEHSLAPAMVLLDAELVEALLLLPYENKS